MSDEEKCHAEAIEEIIGRKMVPLYWIIGSAMVTMLTIYVTIALPVSSKVIELTKEMEGKVSIDNLRSDYLTKGTYIYLQSQSHEADVEAIRNPSNADLIYNKEINTAAETLEFISRGSKN